MGSRLFLTAQRSLLCAVALLLGTVLVFAQPQPGSGGAPPGQKVRLRMTVWDGEEALKALQGEVQRFEEAHPSIDVDLQTVPYGDYFNKLLAQYAANVAPDVVMMGPEQFQRFSSRGVLLPLNQFYGDIPGFDIKSYYKEIVDASSIDNKLYILPRDIAPITIIYYNKRHFREAGLPYPDGTWTWDFKVRPELREKDFLWVLQQLRKKDKNGRTVRWGYAPGWQGLWTQTMLFSNGLRIVDDHKKPTKVFLDDPRVMDIYQRSADMALKDDLMPSGSAIASTQEGNARALFTRQKVSMFHSGIWEVPNMRRDLTASPKELEDAKTDKRLAAEIKERLFDWDIAMAPAFRDNRRGYPTGGSGYSVVSTTRHPKESWLLTQWMAGKPGMLAMARAGIAQPAIRSLALQEPWIPGPNTPAVQQVPQNRIITDTSVPYVVFGISAPYFNDVATIIAQPEPLVYDGLSTAAKEFPRYQKLAQARLDYLLVQESLPRFNWAIGTLIGIVLVSVLLAWVYWPELGKRRTRREKSESRAGYAFIAPWLIGIFVFTVGPMILSLLMAFADWDIVVPARWRGIGNFHEAFVMDPTFWPSIRVTVVYTFLSVPLGLLAALAVALLLNTKVKGMPVWRTCYYIPSIASGVAAAMIWREVFRPEGGLINSILYGPNKEWTDSWLGGLFNAWENSAGLINWLGNPATALGSLILMSMWGAGGGMIILLAGLQGVPPHYYEAATLDGASPWKKLLNVTLPLISPSIFFSMVTGFIGAFQSFQSSFLLTGGGPDNATMFNMLHLFNQGFVQLRMGYASALAWVLFFIILAFTVLQLRMSKWVYYEGAK